MSNFSKKLVIGVLSTGVLFSPISLVHAEVGGTITRSVKDPTLTMTNKEFLNYVAKKEKQFREYMADVVKINQVILEKTKKANVEKKKLAKIVPDNVLTTYKDYDFSSRMYLGSRTDLQYLENRYIDTAGTALTFGPRTVTNDGASRMDYYVTKYFDSAKKYVNKKVVNRVEVNKNIIKARQYLQNQKYNAEITLTNAIFDSMKIREAFILHDEVHDTGERSSKVTNFTKDELSYIKRIVSIFDSRMYRKEWFNEHYDLVMKRKNGIQVYDDVQAYGTSLKKALADKDTFYKLNFDKRMAIIDSIDRYERINNNFVRLGYKQRDDIKSLTEVKLKTIKSYKTYINQNIEFVNSYKNKKSGKFEEILRISMDTIDDNGKVNSELYELETMYTYAENLLNVIKKDLNEANYVLDLQAKE